SDVVVRHTSFGHDRVTLWRVESSPGHQDTALERTRVHARNPAPGGVFCARAPARPAGRRATHLDARVTTGPAACPGSEPETGHDWQDPASRARAGPAGRLRLRPPPARGG